MCYNYLWGWCGEWTGVSVPTLPKPDEQEQGLNKTSAGRIKWKPYTAIEGYYFLIKKEKGNYYACIWKYIM